MNIKKTLFEIADLTEEAIQYKDIFDRDIINKGYDGAITADITPPKSNRC